MSEKEYIERGALIEMCKRQIECEWNTLASPGTWAHAFEDFSDLVEQTPAADVVEVRRGEWKLIETEGFCDGGYFSRFCCPLCLREIGVCHDYENDAYNYAKTMYPYCHCGAKMDATDNNVGDK